MHLKTYLHNYLESVLLFVVFIHHKLSVIYSTVQGLSLYKENPSLVFSWNREIPTRGSTVPVGNEASPSFPLNGGPGGWDFPVPLYTNDRFYFSHI